MLDCHRQSTQMLLIVCRLIVDTRLHVVGWIFEFALAGTCDISVSSWASARKHWLTMRAFTGPMSAMSRGVRATPPLQSLKNWLAHSE